MEIRKSAEEANKVFEAERVQMQYQQQQDNRVMSTIHIDHYMVLIPHLNQV